MDMYKELQNELFEDVDDKTVKKTEVIKQEKRTKTTDEVKSVPCPECGSPLVFEGGCNSCKNCGFSKCD